MALSAEFKAVLADCQDQIDKTIISDDWSPPMSTAGIRYSVLLCGCKTGARVDDDGSKSVWVRPAFRILDGELTGREFGIGFNSRNPFVFGGLFVLASMLTGDQSFLTTKDTAAAAEALEAAVNKAILDLTVKSYTTKDKSKTLPRYVFNQLVQRTS